MLSQKQEIFVQELIKGSSQREAYRTAYGAGNMKDKTLDEKGCRLFKTPAVQARYEELMKGAIAKSEDDAESMRAFIITQLKKIASGELCEISEEYDGDGNLLKRRKSVKPSDVTNAMAKLAEFYGITTEQTEQTINVKFQGKLEDYAD